jgi:thiopurine S-methyltransferase
MEPAFWRERWRTGRIGFHKDAPNHLLVDHFGALELATGDRVFVPLCGKTRDIGWLLARGLRVVGAELSEIAVAALFDDLGVAPEMEPAGPLSLWRADGLDLFVGDIFALDRLTLGPVDAVYDRAALMALPSDMREAYAAHLRAITRTAPQLLVTVRYDPGALEGPPFAIDAAEVERVHGAGFAIERLAARDDRVRDVPAVEEAWLLQPRNA